MSYGPPQGNPPQSGYGPPQGHPQGPPQQGWAPPPGPPPGHQGFPPQGPPQQQAWNAPPGPPPGHQGFPPQGPPPVQQGLPPQGPPPGQHGFPPQQFGGQPAPPSPGYDPRAAAQGDASRDADALRKAMKGFGTDEAALIQILSKPDPLQMVLLKNTYNQRHKRDLEKDISGETSKHFREGLLALVRGPLMQDVLNVHDGVVGLGTKESYLNDVLLGRSNADMRAIKQAYQQKYKKDMESEVKGDLSANTKTLFTMVMAANRAEESAPVIQQEILRDVDDLYKASIGRSLGTDQQTVITIISSKSDAQLRTIAHEFQQRHKRPLQDVAKTKTPGSHLEEALLLIIDRASDRAMADAVQLEESMKGIGTKDQLLVNRIVRVHWDRAHLDQVKRAYQHRYQKDLISRVKGEIHTEQDYKNLMVTILSRT